MIAEKYHDATSGGDDVISSARDYLQRGADQVAHRVNERPGASIMMAGLVGFGIGLLLSQALTAEEDHSYSKSFDRGTAERLGRNLLDRIEQAMPTMLRDRLMK
jgi:hypothetical protein